MNFSHLYDYSHIRFILTSLALLALLLVIIEIGYRAGKRHAKRNVENSALDIGTIQAAILGLLGLLLAFTYSSASTRMETRKQMIVSEANDIGTAFLRADLLPEPQRSALRNALRDYANTRIIEDDVAADPEKSRAAIANSEAILSRLWPIATDLAATGTRPFTPADALVLQSLNAVIDTHSSRLAAGRDHLPPAILALLLFVAFISVGISGYACGLAGHHNLLLTTMLALLITAVMLTIADLDSPHAGLLRASQQSLRDLTSSLNTTQPH
ncbi:MAG TPA: hypothetical protein VM008_07090 [Phycisphaerae bacterium]|nr:hypothetical protein [Phycisphaerae bacterium]